MDTTRLIKTIIISLVALVLALYIGLGAATAQFATVLKVVAVAVFLICLALGRRIWLLVPLGTSLGLAVRIPGQPSTELVAQLLFIGFSILLFLMRKLPYKLVITELELWGVLLIACVAQVYMRNPTGLSLFGGESVGGRPYFMFALMVVVSALFVGLRVPPKELKWAVYLSIFGGLMNFIMFVGGRLFPSVGQYYGAASGGGGEGSDYEDQYKLVDRGASTRIGFLGQFGKNLSLWVATYKSPVKAMIHPGWGFLMLLSVAAAAMSGFRSTVGAVGLTYIVGMLYWSGSKSVFVAALAGAAGIVALSIINLVAPLPPNIQRSLSFIPGTWEERYIGEASGSTDWRLEMWKDALTSDKYIKNKFLGDGLGMTAEELKKSVALQYMNPSHMSGTDVHRENVMLSGDYHSGPVQTIRTIGYVGLFVLLAGLVRLAVHAHRQIIRCKGTEWFVVALFFGIPVVWYPIFFTFVFGDFIKGATALFMGMGMIRMMENNLPLSAYVTRGSATAMKVNGTEIVVGAVARE